MTLTNYWLHPRILREGEGAGGTAPPEGGAPPPAGGEPVELALTPPADGTPPAEDPKSWEGPDWVSEKYRSAENPIEAQAQAYSEAMKKLATKTEDLRGEIETEARDKLTEEIKAEIAKERGAPETPDLYEYPEGWEAPVEAVDKSFRDWAKKHELSQEAFNEAVALYGETQVDFEAERQSLGPNADARIAAMNNWGSKNIPAEMHAAAMKVMQTAEGFELVEHFMTAGRDAGYSPPGGQPSQPLTREAIRAEMNDPRYYDQSKRDPDFVKAVQAKWERFAAQEDAKRK